MCVGYIFGEGKEGEEDGEKSVLICERSRGRSLSVEDGAWKESREGSSSQFL